MAILIPTDRSKSEFNGSNGESELYEKFRELSDDYIIFHSAEWTRKKEKGVQFGESDFAIYHAEYGLLCLEVKSSGIYSEGGRIYQKNRYHNTSHEIKPMHQAEKSAFNFYELLTEELSKIGEHINVYAAVWFTDVKESDVEGEFPQKYHLGNNTFFRNHMVDTEDALLRCFKYYGIQKHKKNSKVNKVIRKILAPSFQVFASMSSLFELNEVKFNQMTREQSYLLDYLEEQKFAAIQGGAGSGKTMLALEKARRLSEEGSKVLFLGFNKLLMDSLQKKYGKDMPNVTFTNLDTLLIKAIGGRYRNMDNQEREAAKIHFLENYEDESVWQFKDIVIDEGQDFSDEQIQALKDIAIIEESSFYVLYDRNQLIQQRSDLKWLNNMECQLVLSFNCRNTLEIAETSAAAIYLENVKVKYSIESSVKPSYHNVENSDELQEYLGKRIAEYIKEGVKQEDIVILTSKTLDKSWLSNVKKLNVLSLTNNFDTDGLLFTTARKFKGLEASVILLIDINTETFSDKVNRMVFYVGASRAKHSLDIISCIEKDDLEKFYFSVSGDMKKKRKTAIREVLKVKVV
ncbi:MAG: NERD domain-containing protein [Carnobacterium sp.]|uniref:nuclease-related domain-containing DEAD/DEAH box helicase n=1 Tax=Carnobacterium sp. TaxID=48221 RepID=UPI003C733966